MYNFTVIGPQFMEQNIILLAFLNQFDRQNVVSGNMKDFIRPNNYVNMIFSSGFVILDTSVLMRPVNMIFTRALNDCSKLRFAPLDIKLVLKH